MGLLDGLLGGGQQRNDFQDFVQRYEQGPPSVGYDDREVSQRYQQVAPHLSQDEYRQSAQDALSRMSSQERQQFGQYLQQQAQQQGLRGFVDRDRDGMDDRLEDPAYLADFTSRIHQQQPDMLGGLLGGGGGGMGGMLGGLMGGGSSGGGGMGGLLGGGAPRQQMGGGGIGDALSNPIAKAALAGIAAMAVKRAMSGGGGGGQQGGMMDNVLRGVRPGDIV